MSTEGRDEKARSVLLKGKGGRGEEVFGREEGLREYDGVEAEGVPTPKVKQVGTGKVFKGSHQKGKSSRFCREGERVKLRSLQAPGIEDRVRW